jgi:AcrR family transcriptional regulator
MKLNQVLERPRRRGRPRDPAVDRAIVEAARSVLARKGFSGASMDEISRTAGVGKDTLYRRWRSKEQLVEHLLTEVAEENVPIPELEDPRFALFVFLQDIVRFNTQSDFGGIVAGMVGESARNPQLADAFHRFWQERRAIAGTIVRRILTDGVADDEVERVVDRLVGPIYYRLLLSGDRISDEYLWGLVASVPWAEEETETI